MTFRLLLTALSLLLGSCAPMRESTNRFRYTVDSAVQHPGDALTDFAGATNRQIGTMVDSRGRRTDFVLDEVVMRFRTQQELDSFLVKYRGQVIYDGRTRHIPGITPDSHQLGSSGMYLIKIDVASSNVDDLEANMERANILGQFTFSSNDAARLVALLARERNMPLRPNTILRGDSTREHQMQNGNHLDAESWPWFSDGPGGLNIAVASAWKYLRYKGVADDQPGTFVPSYIAFIDGGFALDQQGLPLHNNSDYFYVGARPLQVDFSQNDITAGGENETLCSGGSRCPWHGQGAFGVAAARPNNAFGSAGSGGPVARPILVKVGWTWYEGWAGMYSLADAIRASVLFGLGRYPAAVITISIGGRCYYLCHISEASLRDDFVEYMQRTVLTAISFGAIVVASAGNDSANLDDGEDVVPCELSHVICVGAIDGSGQAMSYSNYGRSVDIWAPTNLLSTPNPDSIALDPNQTCNQNVNTACDELPRFGGTSASAPFVAGVIALMVALDENAPGPKRLPPRGTPRIEAVQKILQDTANTSTDLKVAKGYVNALGAVMAIRANARPAVAITFPSEGHQHGWHRRFDLRGSYSDPEPVSGGADTIALWPGKIRFSSDRNGFLCEALPPLFRCISQQDTFQLGQHKVTALAIDAFGATAESSRSVRVVNRPPQVEISLPSADETLFSHIPVHLSAIVNDPDGDIAPASISWRSSITGPLGTGRQLDKVLSAGSHTLTVRVIDGQSAATEAAVTRVVRSGAGLPLPSIVKPVDPCCVTPGSAIVLEGEATDPEDGMLTGSSLRWHSDVDGSLGTGNQISVTLSGPPTPCNPEFRRHRISLTARDRDGNEVSVRKQIAVGQVC